LRKTLILSAALLTVVGAAVAATAAIPDANGVIHGCRNTKTGALRVIDTDKGQTCSKDEAALTWNQTGPQGPAGPPGPQGPAGTDGVSGYVQASNVEQLGTLSEPIIGRTLDVACPSGKVALGGGGETYVTVPATGQVLQEGEVTASIPLPNGWRIRYNFLSFNPEQSWSATAVAYVTCATVA
jgi:hypothetical protein